MDNWVLLNTDEYCFDFYHEDEKHFVEVFYFFPYLKSSNFLIYFFSKIFHKNNALNFTQNLVTKSMHKKTRH